MTFAPRGTMNTLKYILTCFVLVLCVFFLVHASFYSDFSPMVYLGIMYYDSLYKVLPPFCLYYAIFVFHCLITLFLIYLLFKRLNLLSCVISILLCIPMLILISYSMETHFTSIISGDTTSSLGELYYYIYGSNIFLIIYKYITMQFLFMCFYGFCQYVYLKRMKHQECRKDWFYVEDKTSLKTKLTQIIEFFS